MTTRRDYEQEILQCLVDDVYGLTVLELAERIGASRNTVYRYLAILEGKGLVFKKEVGAYNLYFSTEGRKISSDIVNAYYKGLLVAISQDLPFNPSRFKKYGRIISKYVDLPHEMEDYEQLLQLKKPLDTKNLEILSSFIPYFSILHDKLNLKDIVANKEKKEIIFHFINSDMLTEDKSYIYHFFILSGFIEAKIRQKTHKQVRCDVLDYKISEVPEENYIKLALELF